MTDGKPPKLDPSFKELKFLIGVVVSIVFPGVEEHGGGTCFNLKHVASPLLPETFDAVLEALRSIIDVVVLMAREHTVKL